MGKTGVDTLSFLLLHTNSVPRAAEAAAPPGSTGDRRPNLLLILTDDQRWDALGVVQREQGDRARFPWFATPHLDRLAGEGGVTASSSPHTGPHRP
jgi:hypothetical protein